jgi:hypothetical protein
MVNSANQVTTHDQNNDKASRESSNGQAQKDVRKQPDLCKCGVISSSKEPLTTSIRDADGVIFTGRVEQGTLQKEEASLLTCTQRVRMQEKCLNIKASLRMVCFMEQA